MKKNTKINKRKIIQKKKRLTYKKKCEIKFAKYHIQ